MFKKRSMFAALISGLVFNLAGCVSTFNPPPEWALHVDVDVLEEQLAIRNTASHICCNHSQPQPPVPAFNEVAEARLLPDPLLDESWLQREDFSP